MPLVNMGSAGSSSVPANNANAPGVMPYLEPAYLAELLVLRDGEEYVRINTPIPENFELDLSSNYDRPLAGPASQLVGQAMQAKGMQQAGAVVANPLTEQIATMTTGLTSQNKYLSGAVWSSGSVLGISIPFILYAQSDTTKEVLDIELKLMQLAAPSEVAGMLIAPGPRIINAEAIMDTALSLATGGIFGGGTRFSDISEMGGDVITLYLGKFLEIGPCIIRSVSATHDAMFDADGRPITAVLNVAFETYFTTTKEDLEKIFAPSRPRNANP